MKKTLPILFLLFISTCLWSKNDPKLTADLVNLGSGITFSYALPGQQVTLITGIRNNGSSGTTQGSTLAHVISKNNILGDSDDIVFSETGLIPMLGPYGGTNIFGVNILKIITIPSGLASGHYNLYSIVDVNDDINESDESNNVHRLDFTIGQPDIEFSSTNLSFTGNLGETINISGTLINSGNAAVDLWTKVKIVLSENQFVGDNDDIFIKEYNFQSLQAAGSGDSFSFNYDWVVPTQVQETSYNIIIYADSENKIIESDESNNQHLTFIQFTADPDLTLTQINTNQAGVFYEGESITTNFTIKNVGNEAIPQGLLFRVKLKVSRSGVDTEFYNSLSITPSIISPGASYIEYIVSDLPSELTTSDASFELTAEINPWSPTNSIIESDYSNNSISKFITILNDDGSGNSSGGGSGGGGPGGPINPLSINTDRYAESPKSPVIFESINLYPNPANNILKVALPITTDFELFIRDLAGNLMTHGTFKNTNKTLINIGQYASGFYIIRLSAEGFDVSKKFLRK